MTSHIHWIGRPMAGAAVLALFTPVAHAQQGTSTPAPRATPNIITLPSTNGFSLPASGNQPTTRPTATATPTSRPTPAPTPAPTARATPTPRPAATDARPAARDTRPSREPGAPPLPDASPAAQPTPLAAPVVEVSPTPAATVLTTPTPVPAPVASGGAPWLWIIIGAVMASVLVALGWLLGRRRAAPVAKPVVAAPPRPAPPPPVPAAAPPPPPVPRAAPRPALPPEAIQIELRPVAIELADTGAVLEFEMVVINATPAAIEGLRVSYGLMSASQIQDELIAGFHATQLPPIADPFNLAPRDGVRIPGKVPLTPDRINIVDVGGRPMFVPLLMIDLRWRSGLSVRHQTNDFMVGMGGQGEKLGPIWLDKGAQRHTRLNATRYIAKPATAAA